MSCFHPVDGFLSWNTSENKYKVWYNVDTSKFTLHHDFDRFVKMPCGKCVGCLDDKAKDWAKRVQLEALYYPGKCYFVTLTYADEFLQDEKYQGFFGQIDRFTGEVFDDCFINVPQLYKPDLVEFVRKVRYTPPYSPGLRFFGCGEYGTKAFRPHFHLVLFNLNLPSSRNLCTAEGFHSLDFEEDLIPYARGSPYYVSRHLNKLWPYGLHTIFPYSYSTGKYVAKYLVKDQQASEKASLPYFIHDGRTKPFLHMSRRPGIARRFFVENYDRLLHFGNVAISSPNGAFNTSVPQFFYRIVRGKEYVPDQFVEWFELKQRAAYRGQLYVDNLLRSADCSLGTYLRRSEEIAIAESKAKKFLL